MEDGTKQSVRLCGSSTSELRFGVNVRDDDAMSRSCGLPGPLPTLSVAQDPLLTTEIFARRAHVRSSDFRCKATGVSYRFSVVTDTWVPDSLSNDETSSNIIVKFPGIFKREGLSENIEARILWGKGI